MSTFSGEPHSDQIGWSDPQFVPDEEIATNAPEKPDVELKEFEKRWNDEYARWDYVATLSLHSEYEAATHVLLNVTDERGRELGLTGSRNDIDHEVVFPAGSAISQLRVEAFSYDVNTERLHSEAVVWDVAVTELAAAAGEDSVELAWASVDGEVRIERDDELLDVVAGTDGTFIDSDAPHGLVTYRLVLVSNGITFEDLSQEVSVEV